MSTTRRRFLTGAGGVAPALPWLEATAPRAAWAQSRARPTRLVMIAYPMGHVLDAWQPSRAGTGFTLPAITAPLERHRARTLFVSNADNKVTELNAESTFGHPVKTESVLTGTLMRAAFSGDRRNVRGNVIASGQGTDQGGPNGPSICHHVGQAIRRSGQPHASIDVGVSGDPDERNDVRSAFFFEGPATPVGVQCNPARAFHRYLGGVASGAAAAEALRRAQRRKQSVLDLVRASFTELRSGLNAGDRARLEAHAARVRQVEVSLAQCAPPSAGPYGAIEPDASYAPFRTLSMRQRSELMVPTLTHALGCDLAPVGRLEYFDQQSPNFGVPAVDDAIRAWQAGGKDWHAMVHGDASPLDGASTRSTPPASFLVGGYRFFVEQMVAVLDGLAQISDGPDGATALDNTLVMLSSDLGNGGGHAARKLGFVLSGNLGGARTDFHFDARGRDAGFYTDSAYGSTQVLNTVQRIFDVRDASGAPAGPFGLQDWPLGVGELPVF